MIIEKRLNELGITLPPPPESKGSYVTAVICNDLVYLSGTGSPELSGLPGQGKLGSDLTVEQGYQLAQGTVFNLLSTLKAKIGDLDRVEQIVKLLGFVNSAPDFTRHPEVINGASDLLREIFQEKGCHARSAVGTGSLPFNIPVEIEMIVRIKPE